MISIWCAVSDAKRGVRSQNADVDCVLLASNKPRTHGNMSNACLNSLYDEDSVFVSSR